MIIFSFDIFKRCRFHSALVYLQIYAVNSCRKITRNSDFMDWAFSYKNKYHQSLPAINTQQKQLTINMIKTIRHQLTINYFT